MSTERSASRPRITVHRLLDMKRRGEPIVALTAYDFLFAGIVQEAGVDVVLVGDSLGQVVLGYDSTLPVTLDEMIHHAAPGAFVVLDMPFMSFQGSPDRALVHAGRVMKETGVQAVKLEGGSDRVLETVELLVESGIPVMGHLGLTPQSVHALGGYRVQGRAERDAERLAGEARGLQDAGAFAVVLELVPRDLAAEISASLEIPTIGIGAGPECDGQVLVLYDALGLNRGFEPRFLKRFADLHGAALEGVRRYVEEVREGSYPAAEHSFTRDD